jgi:hypothetical protein
LGPTLGDTAGCVLDVFKEVSAMDKKVLKIGALLTVGVAFGCLPCGCPCGGLSPCNLLGGVVTSLATEFLIDNDAVFDLFQDDFGTGTTYDDRFTADPTRDEPDGTVFPRN